MNVNQVVLDNQVTVSYYAKKYYYLGDSREDLKQELNCYLVESLQNYQGKMTNMRSLVTLILRRRVGRLLDHKYGNNGMMKKEEIIQDPKDFDVYFYEMDDLISGVEIDIKKFDEESRKILTMLIQGFSKKEIADTLGVSRANFYEFYLKDIMEKVTNLFLEYGYEMQAV